MKSYEEMAQSVLERRNEYNKRREKQARVIRGISAGCLSLCLIAVIGVGGWMTANQKNDGHGNHGNALDLPPVYETDEPDNTAETNQPEDSNTPAADHVLDTTPGHDVGNIPIEIPDDSTVIHIPHSNSGTLGDINIPITTESLLENANLVVIGEYLGTDSTTVTETMQFISEGRVKVTEVRKGEAECGETLPISFYGGTVPVAQIVNQVPAERLEKYGWLDMTKDEQQRFVVTYSSSLASADLEAGETYLLFLGENEYGNFVMCDTYGARKINRDGKAYNPGTRLYEEIPVLQQYTSLEEAKKDETYGRYLPEYIPAGFWVESIKHFIVGEQDHFSALWSRGYDDISWRITHADEYSDSRRTSVEDTVNYDLSLYPIPRAETVPDELREIVDDPVFDADEITLDVIYRRSYRVNDEGDTDGYRINFSLQIGDVIITVRTKGITPETLYGMLESIIK